MRIHVRHPAVRFIAAHVFASYAWVGGIAAYNVLTRPDRSAPTVEAGFNDADGSGFDDAHEPGDPWYLRPAVIAVFAPVAVPCLLLLAVFFTVASPVERLPLSTCLALLSLYAIPLRLTYMTLGRRGGGPSDKRPTPNRASGDG